jgi:hypothetical protein
VGPSPAFLFSSTECALWDVRDNATSFVSIATRRYCALKERSMKPRAIWARFRSLCILIAVSGSGLGCFPELALAAALSVANPGFEDVSGESPVNEFTFGPLNGWDLYDPNTVTDGGDGPTYFMGTLTPFEPDPIGAPGVFAFFPDGAPEGQRVGIAFSFFGSGGQGEWGVVQALGDTLQANTQYTLQVRVGNIASGTSIGGTLFPLDGFPGYRVELLAGDVVVAQDDNSLAGAIPEGEFANTMVEFTTGVAHSQLGENLAIRLVNLNVVDPAFPNSDLEVDFDDVRLDATLVPQAVPTLSPVHGLLLAAALAALGISRLRC